LILYCWEKNQKNFVETKQKQRPLSQFLKTTVSGSIVFYNDYWLFYVFQKTINGILKFFKTKNTQNGSK
jgi:hypothetical protein